MPQSSGAQRGIQRFGLAERRIRETRRSVARHRQRDLVRSNRIHAVVRQGPNESGYYEQKPGYYERVVLGLLAGLVDLGIQRRIVVHLHLAIGSVLFLASENVVQQLLERP